MGGVDGVGSATVWVGPCDRGNVAEKVIVLGVGGGWYSSSSCSESSLKLIMATLSFCWELCGRGEEFE